MMDRRRFLGAGLAHRGRAGVGSGSLAAGRRPAAWRAGARAVRAARAPDANGIALPDGFTSRVIAVGGETVAGTDYEWHRAPDGGATFPADDGWVYVSNSEVALIGGVSAVRFDGEGTSSTRTRSSPAPPPTAPAAPRRGAPGSPARSTSRGRVWECDPMSAGQGIVRPALGTFSHEAVAVDPDGQQLYLTEDGQSRPRRPLPVHAGGLPGPRRGGAEIAAVDETGVGHRGWRSIRSSAWTISARRARPRSAGPRASGSTRGHVYFTTKNDNRVWDLDVRAQHLSVLYDAEALGSDAPLRGVDNLTVSSAGDLYVAEDGDNLELVVISREREVAPVLRLTGQDGSELTGPGVRPVGHAPLPVVAAGARWLGRGHHVRDHGSVPGGRRRRSPTTSTTSAEATPSTTLALGAPPDDDGSIGRADRARDRRRAAGGGGRRVGLRATRGGARRALVAPRRRTRGRRRSSEPSWPCRT